MNKNSVELIGHYGSGKAIKNLAWTSILTFLCLFLVSCEALPQNPESWMEMKKNACLPTAIAFKEGLKKYDIWTEVVIYSWHDQKTKRLNGHAITAYMYPKGKNQLWTYDYWGSYRVRAYKNDPVDIAQKATNARNENRHVTSASFLN